MLTQRPSGLTAILAFSALLTLSACGTGGPAHGPPTPGVAAVVHMAFHSFEPSTVTVRAGDTVEWRNTSVIYHTVTADPTLADDPSDVSLPPGAAPFHSGRVAAGELYRQTFTVPGTYRYTCLPHEAEGMQGTVVVTPAY